MKEQTAPRLFISYSHDSADHQNRVLALANRLRHDGIDALIDLYNTAPLDGWPMWMHREIQKADFIALVCTETYLRRVEGRESPGKGRGVLWDAKLIYNSLYPEDGFAPGMNDSHPNLRDELRLGLPSVLKPACADTGCGEVARLRFR